MASPDTPKIEFPCAYPIKIIGDSAEGDVARIIQVVRDHAPEVTPDQVTTRKSRAGNFQSIRVTLQATGEPQLKALHEALMALPGVRMVL